MNHPPSINKTASSLAIGLCLTGAACLPANAVLVNYSLTPGNFTSQSTAAGSLSGSFVYDTGSNTFSSVNITTTAASNIAPNFNFTSINYTTVVFGSSASAIFGDGGSQNISLTFAPNLNLAFLNNPSSFGASESQGSFSRTANDIVAIGTPVPLESDAMSVVGAGAFLSGAYWLKRRRNAKSLAQLSLSDVDNN